MGREPLLAKLERRVKKEQRRLHTYLGRVIRDIEPKLPEAHAAKINKLLELARRIMTQQRHDKCKA
ncbi:MAG: hypothetical protein ABIR84_10660 [Candidatus Nitrotoga sp.]